MKYVFIFMFLVISSYSFAVVKIDIYNNKNGDIYGFEASGHALFDLKNKDVLCAAISVLIQNTYFSIKSIAKENTQIEKKEGYFKLIVPKIKDNQQNHDATVLLKSLALGLLVLHKQYGNDFIILNFIKD